MNKNAKNTIFQIFGIPISPNIFIRKEEFDLCRDGRHTGVCDAHHGDGCSFGIK
jgi:hypothetical protein